MSACKWSCARRAPWLAVWLAGMAALPVLGGDPSPPRIPKPAADAAPAARVLSINEDCSVVVRASTSHRSIPIVLAGIRVPRGSEQRRELRRFLTQLLEGERVWLRPEPGAKSDKQVAQLPWSLASVSEDRGGKVARAWLFRAPDGLFVNLEVVRQGVARAELPPGSSHRRLFRYYETRARRSGRGLWDASAGGSRRDVRSPAKRVSDASVAHKVAPRQTDGAASARTGSVTVYVTKSGKKYHRKGCVYLRRSSRAISLEEAIRKGYTPCSRCKPPVPKSAAAKKGGG